MDSLMLRRQAMIGSGLPGGLVRVPYVVCTGYQVIDLGLTGNNTTSALIDFHVTDLVSGTGRTVFGDYSDSSHSLSITLGASGATSRYGDRNVSWTWAAGGDYAVTIGPTGITRTGTDPRSSSWSAPSSFTTGANLKLGWAGTLNYFKGWIRECGIWSGGSQVRWLIPCYSASGYGTYSEHYVLYDLINNKVYSARMDNPSGYGGNHPFEGPA